METRDRRILFQGLVLDIEQMEVRIGEKGWHRFQVARHPGGVAVLPLHDDGTVSLIRQLRPAVDAELLEIPAGRLAPGEDPEACGRRELIEETGLRAETLSPLGILHPSPGVLDEAIHLFLATGLSQGTAAPETFEEIATVRMPLGEVRRMAGGGAITDGKTLAALLRLGDRTR
ncbi:MAG TPA: NUDIX hydrolase [Candidatus Deferrimicrobiaceae bacterium]